VTTCRSAESGFSSRCRGPSCDPVRDSSAVAPARLFQSQTVARQSYDFNYYETIGSNRYEFVIVSRLAKWIRWSERQGCLELNPVFL